MRNASPKSESGAVIVIVALWLPLVLIFISFAIDFAHFFDYSRNLQNRADAAALAAVTKYGNTCSSSPTSAQTDPIGKLAQQYAGPPAGTPSGNLPFPSISGTYQNQPNLTQGTPGNFHMLLNSTQNWPSGTNWSMGTAGHTTDSTALCFSKDEDGNIGPMVDVRLTQADLGLIFPFQSFRPTINAHARAALEGEASTSSEPIAVADSGQTPCVSVRLVNATTNDVIQTIPLSKEPTDPNNPTAPVQWDNSAAPFSFTPSTSDNVYVQPFLNDCNGTGQILDGSSNTGLLMINYHPASDPTVPTGSAPQLNAAGVTATGTCTSGTQYFSVGGCTITVNAGVTFASGIPNGQRNVYLLQRTWDNVNNVWVTPAPSSQNKMSSGGQCPANSFCGNATIADTSGIDQFAIAWSQTSGSINGTSCSGNPTPAACQGNFGVQQQSFGACNGCDQPDNSGAVVFSRISEADSSGVIIGNDTNSFAAGSTHRLVFTFKLSGLNTATPGSPPTVLRFANSTNHQTGLVDCGQGASLNGDSEVVYYGCGPGNPFFTNPPLNPLFVYSRTDGSGCSPATDGNTTGWPNGDNQDCVQTTPGQRRIGIICPLVDRIVNNPYGTGCTGGATGTCPANNWSNTTGSQNIPVGDPRAVQMIITSPADFASGAGSPQAWLPIRKFATFYITGWDKNIKPQCPGNEPFPLKGKQNSDNGAVWGHWINYEDTAGTPNGQLCVIDPSSPTNCVPALTR
jgi:Putative Flp pilus-assembly TadE/G-like